MSISWSNSAAGKTKTNWADVFAARKVFAHGRRWQGGAAIGTVMRAVCASVDLAYQNLRISSKLGVTTIDHYSTRSAVSPACSAKSSGASGARLHRRPDARQQARAHAV